MRAEIRGAPSNPFGIPTKLELIINLRPARSRRSMDQTARRCALALRAAAEHIGLPLRVAKSNEAVRKQEDATGLLRSRPNTCARWSRR
jgi:hypothetical protein